MPLGTDIARVEYLNYNQMIVKYNQMIVKSHLSITK